MLRTYLGLLLAISSAANADANLPSCSPDGPCKVERVLKDNAGNSHKVAYHFYYRPAVENAPTVVWIPGGPGSTSMDLDSSNQSGIPNQFGLILTDPIFRGTNSHPDGEEFSSSVTSETVAKDIYLALMAVRPHSIIVYGQSYGSVPATILASLLRVSELKLSALVLDGPWGRSFSQREYAESFTTEWKRTIKVLGSDKEARLKAVLLSIRQGKLGPVIAHKLGACIQVGLMMQKTLESKPIFEELLSQLEKNNIRLLSELCESIDLTPNAFTKNIVCREMTHDGNLSTADFSYRQEFVPNFTDECGSFAPSLPRKKYDSGDFQVIAPIFYLRGENDPAAPFWQFSYHYNHQISAEKK